MPKIPIRNDILYLIEDFNYECCYTKMIYLVYKDDLAHAYNVCSLCGKWDKITRNVYNKYFEINNSNPDPDDERFEMDRR